MSTGQAIICKLPELQDIEGADRIKSATIFGETIIVSTDHKKGELGILFDCETQLSHEFCSKNNLYRHSEHNVNKTKEGYFQDNRRVRPIRLKGVKVSGFWMPITSLQYIEAKSGRTISGLEVGVQLDEVHGEKICEKFVTKSTQSAKSGNKQGRVSKKDLVPTFKEHFDTDHWLRGNHLIKDDDFLTITEKLHGTSFRCGNMLTLQKTSWWKKLFGIETPPQYKFVVGSRRTVKSIEGEEINNQHYYSEDLWTEICNREFKGKLEKGEAVYGEIVGYTPSGTPIMGTHSNSKLKPFMDKKEYKEFINTYGETTEFNYGCVPENNLGVNNEVYVYRITRQNEDGETIDLTWEQVKQRCEQLGVEHVPELFNFQFDSGYKDHYFTVINQILDKDSKKFPMHLKEGICIRVDNGSLTPKILKHKAYYFKVLEGIIKEQDVVDIEESN